MEVNGHSLDQRLLHALILLFQLFHLITNCSTFTAA